MMKHDHYSYQVILKCNNSNVKLLSRQYVSPNPNIQLQDSVMYPIIAVNTNICFLTLLYIGNPFQIIRGILKAIFLLAEVSLSKNNKRSKIITADKTNCLGMILGKNLMGKLNCTCLINIIKLCSFQMLVIHDTAQTLKNILL